MESDGTSNQWIKYTTELPISPDNDTPTDDIPINLESSPLHYIPVASVICVMRSILPAHAKIADAKKSIQERVTEFITIITAEAGRRCNSQYRKIITPEDAISAIRTTGFNNFTQPLTVYLNKHRAQDPDHGHVTTSSHSPFLDNSGSPQFVQQPPTVQPQTAPPQLMGVYLTNQGYYGEMVAQESVL